MAWATERPARAPELPLLEGSHRQARRLELLPVVLGRLLGTAVDGRLAGVVDHVGNLVSPLEADAGDVSCKRPGDVVEGVVVVVAHDHAPRASEPRIRAS